MSKKHKKTSHKPVSDSKISKEAVEDSTKDVEDSTKDVEDSTKDVEDSTKDVEDSTKDVEDSKGTLTDDRLRGKDLVVNIILKVLVVFNGLLIIFLGVALINFMLNKPKPVKHYQDDKTQAISVFNTEQFKFFVSNYYGKQSTLVSPLAIENALYQYRVSEGTVDDKIFDFFNNGVKDFTTSKQVFDYSDFAWFTSGSENADTISNEDAIKMQIRERSNNQISNTILTDLDLEKSNIFAVTYTGLNLKPVYKDDTQIIIQGAEVLDTHSLKGVRFDTEDGKYTVTYLLPEMYCTPDDLINSYTTSTWVSDSNAKISIKTMTLQQTGYSRKYVAKLSEGYISSEYAPIFDNLYTVDKLEYITDDTKNDKDISGIDYTVEDDFILIVQDKQTSQILNLSYIGQN